MMFLFLGESTAQIKESLQAGRGNEEEVLNMKGAHKNNVLFGGTVIIQHTAPEEKEKNTVFVYSRLDVLIIRIDFLYLVFWF